MSAFNWLLEMPLYSERIVRMEALVARLRLVVVAANTLALAFFLDTSGMQMRAAWSLVMFTWAYGLPVALLEPYRRWRVFRGSPITAGVDALAIALFVAATGAAESPFYLLYFLAIVAMAMRFELRQTIAGAVICIATYVAVYVGTAPGLDEMGLLLLRCAYMFIAAVGAGYLSREENSRSRAVEEIERLNAEKARLMSRNERAARMDRITGLYNRAYFEKVALKEFKRARHAGRYVSVLFCDMDNLKRINDELGHDAGDRVLKQVGSALRHAVRTPECVGRYGGDEFVVVLPDTTREGAYDRGLQLVESVCAVNEWLSQDLHIGLSVGVATQPFDAADFPTLVKLADQAMYLAKHEGGNRVRTATDLRLYWEEIPHSA